MEAINHVSQLTKENIADLYIQSLGNPRTRLNHVLLKPKIAEATAMPVPSVHDIEQDFTSWYGGLVSLATALEPSIHLPSPKEMTLEITQEFERAKAAVAA